MFRWPSFYEFKRKEGTEGVVMSEKCRAELENLGSRIEERMRLALSEGMTQAMASGVSENEFRTAVFISLIFEVAFSAYDLGSPRGGRLSDDQVLRVYPLAQEIREMVNRRTHGTEPGPLQDIPWPEGRHGQA